MSEARKCGELVPPPVMHLQDLKGLVLWPHEEIAMLRTERSGRLEATSAWGEVAHRPGPLAEFEGPPWVKAAPGVLVHPRHARVRGKELLLPGGWRLPFEGTLPRPARRPALFEPILPGIGVRPSEVLYLKSYLGMACYWMTDRGRLPAKGEADQVAALHPWMLRLRSRYVNRTRLRALRFGQRPRLLLSDGTRLVLDRRTVRPLLAALCIPDAHYVERLVPAHRVLYLLGLRDWPRPLAEARAAELEAMFGGNELVLVANVLWQTRERRARGEELTDGTSHRGYWYNPLRPILQRAGVPLGAAKDDVVTLSARSAEDDGFIPPGAPDTRYGAPRPHRLRPGLDRYLYYQYVLERMVDSYLLLTYQELGFDDPRPDLRAIGALRPEVVLLVEKDTVTSLVFELARRFGCSLLVTGGNAKLISTEFLVGALRAVTSRPLQVVAYVDYDDAGWSIAHGFAGQAARYGMRVAGTGYLVRPSRFTAEEIRNLAYPLTARRAMLRTRIARWVEATGGIGGKALGISADGLRTIERLAAAFEEETGLAPC